MNQTQFSTEEAFNEALNEQFGNAKVVQVFEPHEQFSSEYTCDLSFEAEVQGSSNKLLGSCRFTKWDDEDNFRFYAEPANIDNSWMFPILKSVDLDDNGYCIHPSFTLASLMIRLTMDATTDYIKLIQDRPEAVKAMTTVIPSEDFNFSW
jgi:hypothetical protein